MQGLGAPKPMRVESSIFEEFPNFPVCFTGSPYSPWRLLRGPAEQLLAKLGENCPSLTCLLSRQNLLSWKKQCWSLQVECLWLWTTGYNSRWLEQAPGNRVSGQSWPSDLRLSLWSRGQCSILVIALLPIFGRSQPIFALFSANSHCFMPISMI